MLQVVNKHWHKPTPNDIYIGRGSPLGNKWSHMENTKAEHKVSTREEAISKYSENFHHAMMNDALFARGVDIITETLLRGQDVNLVCYCKPASCHGDVIKKHIDHRVWECKKAYNGTVGYTEPEPPRP